MQANSKHIEWANDLARKLNMRGEIQELCEGDMRCLQVSAKGQETIAQHLAAFEAEVTGWKPIADLPKSLMVLLTNGHVSDTAMGFNSDYGFLDANGMNLLFEPTHYREITLPAQPEKEGE